MGLGRAIIDERRELLQLGAPYRIGPIGELGLSLFNRWKPDEIFVIVTVYIDESGTHTPSPFMMMGGYAGRLGQWNKFDGQWRRLLRRYDLSHFHSHEMMGRRDLASFFPKARKLTSKHTMFGFVIKLARDDYRSHYIDYHPLRKPQPDTMYGLGFRYCLSFVPEVIKNSLLAKDITINFLLEDGHEHFGDALRIFNETKKDGPQEIASMLGTLIPGEKRRFPGLQTADSLATEAYKYEPVNPPRRDLLPDETLSSIRKKNPRRTPTFFFDCDQHVLRELKDNILYLTERRRQFWEQRTQSTKSIYNDSSEE
jgi:hypothetical protein